MDGIDILMGRQDEVPQSSHKKWGCIFNLFEALVFWSIIVAGDNLLYSFVKWLVVSTQKGDLSSWCDRCSISTVPEVAPLMKISGILRGPSVNRTMKCVGQPKVEPRSVTLDSAFSFELCAHPSVPTVSQLEATVPKGTRDPTSWFWMYSL